MRVKIIQFLLLGLSVIGIFAAMARNNYGFTLVGLACFGLAFLFLAEQIFTEKDRSGKHIVIIWIESILLAALLALFGLRAFYIYLSGGEFIFIAVGLLLIIVYLVSGYRTFVAIRNQNARLAWIMITFYSSILLFLLTMLTRNSVFWSLLFGAMGALASLPFLWSVFRKQKYEFSGELISSFNFLKESKSKIGLLFLFFIFSGLYTGLTQFSLIPEIENTDRPKAYIELIEQAESGKDKQQDGQYQHEKYKEAMDKFLERHGGK